MKRLVLMAAGISVLLMTLNVTFGVINLGPEELVEANGVDISVGTYSVPSFAEWNNDGKMDLVIGCGIGKVRVYLNTGTQSNPQFLDYFYAQSNGADLYCPPFGCMGCFPRVVYWDSDERKDLLVGQSSDGTVKIFLNTGTDENPTFDGGTLLQVGQPGSKTNLKVGYRATPCVVDWNSDDRKDLAIGALDGKIHIFINEGTDTEPDFRVQTYAQQNGSNLSVPYQRSSPDVLDLDGDGKKDLITGNTNGQLLFYSNTGTDQDPNFSGYSAVEADGVPIDLPDTPRSRPYVCYLTDDAYFDVLIGAADGKVHLYQGIPEPGDMDGDGDVDFDDFAAFALYWQQTSCGLCGGADLANNDGNVYLDDLGEFAANWLMDIN